MGAWLDPLQDRFHLAAGHNDGMTPERWQLLRDRLDRRQPDLTVVLERVHKPHNLAAVVRSADAAGLYEAHIVPGEGGSHISPQTAQGAEKWVRLHRHRDIRLAALPLRERGFTLLAAHLDEGAVDFREVDYTRPTAVIFGAEKQGVSMEAASLADRTIHIPMEGLVQSLNISVACALVLFEAQRQRRAAGLYDRCRLDAGTYEQTLFEWAYPHVARRFRERREPYPALDAEGWLPVQARSRRRLP